ncbi:hypothetical protein KKB55_07820, partial [Myxococcota bacterium]|nr:hypothetical protein [Myxococcota bacterium]MBU1897663.1 hypothetical protein [Myxococcota bacterium]
MRYFALFALLIACDDAHTSSDPPLPDGRVRDAMSAPPLDARVRPTEDAQPPGKPDALSPDALSPDALSPDALSPDALSP